MPGIRAFNKYNIALSNGYGQICDLGLTPSLKLRLLQSTLSKINAQVISYKVPESPKFRLDRCTATSILRKFGLRTPSTFEVIHIAVEAITNPSLLGGVTSVHRRNMVALTPFNPEDPSYLVFHQSTDPAVDFILTREEHRITGYRSTLTFPDSRPILLLGIKP